MRPTDETAQKHRLLPDQQGLQGDRPGLRKPPGLAGGHAPYPGMGRNILTTIRQEMTTALEAPPLGPLLDDLVQSHRPGRETGSVPANIPFLADVPFDTFGIAVATTSGQLFSSGDAGVPFSIQSISKVFTLAMA